MANRKPRRPRRQFTPEFKAEIVELCPSGDRSVPQIVKDFDLTETAMRLWVAQGQGQESVPRAQESGHRAPRHPQRPSHHPPRRYPHTTSRPARARPGRARHPGPPGPHDCPGPVRPGHATRGPGPVPRPSRHHRAAVATTSRHRLDRLPPGAHPCSGVQAARPKR
ncbi:transposase [Streptomyces sp. NBC_01214]|uniref:transposase n=1 Tax=Streptomyces sp. NBC_01214 TaxID=2903777 RepID=UPI0022559F01|nr:transposase [Streptomyces sp. NBC_01214]MCX4804757.1 transposase [Streptomyces sp. NBC_01214]